MTSTAVRGVLAGALAFGALTAAATAAQDRPPPRIETFVRAVFILDVSFPSAVYVVNAHQRTGWRTARVYVSAHGLKPGTRYEFVGSTRSCSRRPHSRAGRVFRVTVRTSARRGDAFRSARVALSLPLRRARTISARPIANSVTSGQLCAITGSYDSGTGTLT